MIPRDIAGNAEEEEAYRISVNAVFLKCNGDFFFKPKMHSFFHLYFIAIFCPWVSPCIGSIGNHTQAKSWTSLHYPTNCSAVFHASRLYSFTFTRLFPPCTPPPLSPPPPPHSPSALSLSPKQRIQMQEGKSWFKASVILHVSWLISMYSVVLMLLVLWVEKQKRNITFVKVQLNSSLHECVILLRQKIVIGSAGEQNHSDNVLKSSVLLVM